MFKDGAVGTRTRTNYTLICKPPHKVNCIQLDTALPHFVKLSVNKVRLNICARNAQIVGDSPPPFVLRPVGGSSDSSSGQGWTHGHVTLVHPLAAVGSPTQTRDLVLVILIVKLVVVGQLK